MPRFIIGKRKLKKENGGTAKGEGLRQKRGQQREEKEPHSVDLGTRPKTVINRFCLQASRTRWVVNVPPIPQRLTDFDCCQGNEPRKIAFIVFSE